jgi:hypothetical protein
MVRCDTDGTPGCSARRRTAVRADVNDTRLRKMSARITF